MNPGKLHNLSTEFHSPDPSVSPSERVEASLDAMSPFENEVQSKLAYITEIHHQTTIYNDNTVASFKDISPEQMTEDKKEIIAIFESHNDSIDIAASLVMARLEKSKHNQTKGLHQSISDVLFSMVNDSNPRVDALFDKIFNKADRRLYDWLVANKSLEQVEIIVNSYTPKPKAGVSGLASSLKSFAQRLGPE